ncbi:hypothetical protein L6R52_26425 [Myxococcota bacterium]|nr:hypothetical protein [Myxococcota bacterium]
MRAVLRFALILLPSLVACTPPSAPAGTASTTEPAAAAALPRPIVVTAERRDLVFSYVSDGPGGFATATSIAAVPEGSRGTVVVTDLSLTPEQRQAGRYVYVADLRAPRADGTYAVAVASRYGFEAKLTGTSSVAASGAGVVVYSASWCGVCQRAKQVLRQLGVPFVEKDVEASRSAAEELAAKARRAGIQPSGVPVIDVAGVLLQGLDERTLESVLRDRGLLR